jgi:signal transduction histidine kinase
MAEPRPAAADSEREPSSGGPSHRTRVLGILALAGLPLLLLAAVSLSQGVADVEAQIAEERVDLARAAALATAAFVDGNLATLRGLALTRSFTDPAAHADVARLLDRIRAEDPNWDVLGFADREGWNVAITGLPPRTVHIAHLGFFQQVQATGRPVVSPAFTGRVRGIPLIALAVPVELASGERGVLSGSLSLERLQDELQQIVGDHGIQVVVLDSEGQVFIHPDPAVAGALTSLRGRADAEAALAGETGSRRTVEVDGTDTLVAYAPVPKMGWGVLVQQPAAAAFDVARQQVAAALTLFALAAAVAGWLSWHLGGRLSLLYQRQLDARARAEVVARELRVVSAENEGHRRFLEELIASAPVAIAITRGPEHRFVTANPRYRELKPGSEMLGKTLVEVFPEAERQGTVERWDRVYATGEQLSTLDYPFAVDTDSGEVVRYLNFVLSRHEDADGRPEGLLIVAMETTAAVLARQRAEREKDDFLSMASHDLKSPLTSLGLAAQMIDRMLGRGAVDRPRLERHVATIREQVARASLLIGDLLDVSRMETGQLERRREPVDLVKLARAAVQRQRDALPDDATHEIVETAEEPLVVEGDEARLDQVLTNLLSNAVKYSPDGGRIDVRLGRDDGQATIEVADHGVGVPEAERDRLFAPFSRTTAAVRSGVEGTGLGLYITRRIVEEHGGTIGFTETPGGGATFLVRLPLGRGEVEHPEVGEAA